MVGSRINRLNMSTPTKDRMICMLTASVGRSIKRLENLLYPETHIFAKFNMAKPMLTRKIVGQSCPVSTAPKSMAAPRKQTPMYRMVETQKKPSELLGSVTVAGAW